MSIKNRKLNYGKVEITKEAFDPKNVKERITIMIDQDILDAYRAKARKLGDKYQSLINRTLRQALASPDLEERLSAIENKLKRLG